jgi:hypothetical protein
MLLPDGLRKVVTRLSSSIQRNCALAGMSLQTM